MAEKQDVGKGDPLPEDAIEDYLPSEVPEKNFGTRDIVDVERTSGSVEEDLSAPNIHYGSRLEGQGFQDSERNDSSHPPSNDGDRIGAEPPPVFGNFQQGVLQAGGNRDDYFVTEGAPSEYRIEHIPSGTQVVATGLEQQNRDIRVFAEAARQHATGGAGANNDIIKS